jgi:anti-anti-sigma factor
MQMVAAVFALQAKAASSRFVHAREGALLATTADQPRHAVEPFSVRVKPERDVVRVIPVGELDIATVHELERAIRELLDAGFRRLVIDLRELDFIGSTGLRLILTLDAASRQDGIDFALIPGPHPVQRVFEISGVLERLPFRTV